MKKAVLFGFFIIVTLTSIHAQDLIVTQEGDSINCKIEKVKRDYVYFIYQHEGAVKNSLMPLEQVRYYQENYFREKADPADYHLPLSGKRFPRWRLGGNGGYSYRLGKIPDGLPIEIQQYIKGIKSGHHFSGDFIYYFTDNLGLGAQLGNSQSFNQMDNVSITDDNGNTRYGKMEDDISIIFFGPVFSTRFLNADNQSAFISNVALGYMGYRNKAILVDPLLISGNTVSLSFDFGYDFKVAENILLGLQASYLMGVLTELEVSQGFSSNTIKLAPEEYENLSRIDLSLGLRFVW